MKIRKLITSNLIAIAAIAIQPCWAQNSLYVVKNDGNVFGYKISEVQEINFERQTVNNPVDAMPSDAKALAKKMHLGINIGNTFEAVGSWCDNGGSETCWGSPVITKQIIDEYKKAGFNAIRIPVAWDNYTENKTDYTIKSAWMSRIKEVVDYVIADSMYAIINIHWDNGWLEKNCTTSAQESVNREQAALWKQIATCFKGYGEFLLFASANEPDVNDAEAASVLKSYHQTFVNTVRATGGNNAKRCLIVQGPSTAIDKSLQYDVLPTDTQSGRMMFEVHYYPYTYCLMEKDETWGNMSYFWGNKYQNIYIDGVNRSCAWHTESTVDEDFGNMKRQFVDKGIPVLLGEFAAMNRTLEGDLQSKFEESRAYFYEYVVKTAKNNGIVPVLWDTHGSGVIDRDNCSVANQTAIDGLLLGADNGKYPF